MPLLFDFKVLILELSLTGDWFAVFTICFNFAAEFFLEISKDYLDFRTGEVRTVMAYGLCICSSDINSIYVLGYLEC